MKLSIFRPRNSSDRGRKLSDGDFILWGCIFSGVFAVMNYKLLLGQQFAVSIWRLAMSLITLAFWMGLMFSAGRSGSKKALYTMLIIWGCSLIYGALNTKLLDASAMSTLDRVKGIAILILSPFASATVVAMIPGLVYLGYLPQTMSEYMLIAAACMVLFSACWAAGMLYSRRILARESERMGKEYGEAAKKAGRNIEKGRMK